MADTVLEARNVSKSFPGVQALQNVELKLRRGEVLAVVGENGAGKSTLMKILAGVEQPDRGAVVLDGKTVRLSSVDQAQRLGVALIHQELNLATNLDVAANVFLGREPRRGGILGLLHPRIYADAQVFTARLGLNCSLRTPVARLSIGQQQLVEIARALSLHSRILIMDEPTSSLTQRETDKLFAVIGDLRRQGISILFISHHLQEVEAIADRVVVLRDGKNAGELQRDETSHEAMVQLMVGRELKQFFHRTHHRGVAGSQAPVLRGEGIRLDVGSGRAFDFELHAGGIVGLAGLMGSGRTELAQALFGAEPPKAGRIFVSGLPVKLRTVSDAIRQGIFLLPEDRRLHGLILEMNVKGNLTVAAMEQVSRWGLIQRGRERAMAQSLCDKLNVRTPSLRQTVGLLSGGNQQKVVVGKALTRSPRILILDEPTRGIDVGAKGEIYALMDRLAQQGVALLMISSDLEEILGMSDRVLVMHEGAIAGELSREQVSEQAIMRLATGGAAQQ